jgi:hypothetical protein
MRTIPPTKRDDWAALVIDPDGTFRFASVRTIGVLSGGGQFTLNNGHVVASSERGSIDASLYEADQHRLLRAKARAADGTEYIVELRPHK